MSALTKNYKKFYNDVISKESERYAELGNGQAPETLFITCSDSRICPNHITDTKEGELFVIRNAGNLVPSLKEAPGTNEGLTIEYAVTQLKVKNIIVSGHSGCGAMGAVLGFETLPSELTFIKAGLEKELHLRDKLKGFQTPTAETEIDRLIELNVNEQVSHLADYPFIKKEVEAGNLNLFGWVYDFTNGNLKYKKSTDKNFTVL